MPPPQASGPAVDPGLLADISFFSFFSQQDLLALCASSRIRTYGPGEILFRIGEKLEELSILLNGEIEHSVMVDGQPCVIEIARVRAPFGEAAVFSQDPSETMARAAKATTVLAVPALDLLKLLGSRFDLQRHVLSVFSQRLRLQIKLISELKLKTTAQRLGIYLLSLTDETKGGARVELPADKRRIAEELGMQPESLSRSLGKLAIVGVYPLPGNKIGIADIAALRQFCIADE